jgi:hypothetical protein
VRYPSAHILAEYLMLNIEVLRHVAYEEAVNPYFNPVKLYVYSPRFSVFLDVFYSTVITLYQVRSPIHVPLISYTDTDSSNGPSI